MLKSLITPILLVLCLFSVKAQEPGKSELISELASMEGRWVGQAFGGEVEEIWTARTGNTMWGMFRVIKNGQTQLAEIEQLIEQNDSLHYRVRHFNGDFIGWEDKQDYVQFPFVRLIENGVVFDGLKIIFLDENTMKHFIQLSNGKSSEVEQVEILYKRINK